jgi:hypothetical protein
LAAFLFSLNKPRASNAPPKSSAIATRSQPYLAGDVDRGDNQLSALVGGALGRTIALMRVDPSRR